MQHVVWTPNSRGLLLGSTATFSNSAIELLRVTWKDDSISGLATAALGPALVLGNGSIPCSMDGLGRMWAASPPNASGIAATIFRIPAGSGGSIAELARMPLAGSRADGCAGLQNGATAYFAHQNESAAFAMEGNTDLGVFQRQPQRLFEEVGGNFRSPGVSLDGKVVLWVKDEAPATALAGIRYESIATLATTAGKVSV